MEGDVGCYWGLGPLMLILVGVQGRIRTGKDDNGW